MNGPRGDPQGDPHGKLRTELFRQLEFPELKPSPPRGTRKRQEPAEFKEVALRDCPLPKRLLECDTPQKAVDYWRLHVATAPTFNPEIETLVVLHLNVRGKVRGHHVVATGTLDSVVAHSREVFRTAIVAASAKIILMHNHPSGDPSPSPADLRVTRQLILAGRLLQIEVLDHVIVGSPQHISLKELGYFYE
ncbi:MAG TPA: JAB domain-containing protein [Verrucomicrobiota bacterium]|nr:JAB domain-containing protein [Verrucomicrobiota bacterium]